MEISKTRSAVSERSLPWAGAFASERAPRALSAPSMQASHISTSQRLPGVSRSAKAPPLCVCQHQQLAWHERSPEGSVLLTEILVDLHVTPRLSHHPHRWALHLSTAGCSGVPHLAHTPVARKERAEPAQAHRRVGWRGQEQDSLCAALGSEISRTLSPRIALTMSGSALPELLAFALSTASRYAGARGVRH